MTGRAVTGRLTIAAAIGGVLPFAAVYWWPLELLTHFRVQYIVLGAALTVAAFAFRQHMPGLALAAVTSGNAWPLLPYLPRSAPAESTQHFKVLNANVNAGNEAHATIVEKIFASGSDLVAVVELSHGLDEALPALDDQYPHRYTIPAFGNFGIGVISRYPLVGTQSFLLGDTPAIDARVALPDGDLRFLAVHLVPPMGGTLAAERNRQLDELANYAAVIDEPLMVCGDFNLTPYSPYLRRFAAAAQLTDTRLGKGLAISWPTFLPLLGIPIDHCLVRGPLSIDSISRLEQNGSDHYPVQLALGWLDER